MKPKDFALFVNAQAEKTVETMEIARRLAYFSAAPHMGKPMTMVKFFSDYWPLPGDEEGQTSRRERLIQRIKKEKAKVNGNRET